MCGAATSPKYSPSSPQYSRERPHVSGTLGAVADYACHYWMPDTPFMNGGEYSTKHAAWSSGLGLAVAERFDCLTC